MRERVKPDERWFDRGRYPEGEAHGALLSLVKTLQSSQGDEARNRCADLLALYQGVGEEGFSGSILEWFDDSLSYNVTQSCSDTLISHVLQNKVNPMFLTSGGSYEERQKAKGMQRAVEGQFSESGIYGPLGEDVCSDGIVFGQSGVYVWADCANMRVRYERVMPWEALVSARDAARGDPRSLYYVTRMDRAVLLEAYGKNAALRDAIQRAPKAPADKFEAGEDDSVSDQVEVVRAWHRPSGSVDRDDAESWGMDKDGNEIDPNHDGRAIVAIEGETLSDEPWPYDYHPIAWFRPKRSRLGFRGRGIPEQLVGIQYEINKMMARISAIMQLHAMPIIYLWSQSGVNPYKLQRNDFSRILVGRQPAGSAIQYITPQSVPAEYIAQLQRLIEYAYRLTGISELSASSKKPAGVEAAVAMQLLQDTESIRHTTVFRAWENFHVDCARITVDSFRVLSEEAEEEKRDFEVIWQGDRELMRVKWGEVDLAEDRYRLRVWPVSLLPRTPAARMQRVVELMSQQLISPEKALELLDFPDVETVMSDEQAAMRNVNSKIDRAIENGRYDEQAAPSPYTNLELLIQVGTARYQALEADGATDDVLDSVRHLIEHAVKLQKMAKPPPPVEPSMPPVPPGPGGGLPMPIPGEAAPPMVGQPVAA